jgi:hypothetical protein
MTTPMKKIKRFALAILSLIAISTILWTISRDS